MKQYETFGQALFRLLQSKECTIKELTKRMNLKSSNTIARLVADKSSPHKISDFCQELLRQNPLQLVEYEKQQLREAVAVSTVGVDAYTASQHMLYFVQEHPQTPACICKQAFGEGSLFISTLDDLLQSYSEYQSVSIMLQNCALGGVTRAIKALLEQPADAQVTIEHYINVSRDQSEEIRDFLNLLDIMGHPNYSFFFSPLHCNGGQDFVNVYSNIMVALKCDRAGNKYTDIITFHTEDQFTVLYNLPGETSYQFNQYQFQTLRAQHNPAKATYSSNFNLSGMLDYNRHLLEMDQVSPLISIRSDISLCMVPPDIIQSTIDQVCRGQTDAECGLYRQVMQVINRRYQLFCAPGKRQRYLFSRSGMCGFLKYGKSKANVFGLRELVPDERRRVIKSILDVAKHVPTTTFHLIKNDLHYNNTTYLLYGKNALLIDNYPGFRNYDPVLCYHSGWVRTPNITESFTHFVENTLIPDYTYSSEETIAFLEDLLT